MRTIDLANRLTLTRAEVAQVLGFGVKKVDRMRAAGKLPSFLEEGTRLFPVPGVVEYVAQRLREASAAQDGKPAAGAR